MEIFGVYTVHSNWELGGGVAFSLHYLQAYAKGGGEQLHTHTKWSLCLHAWFSCDKGVPLCALLCPHTLKDISFRDEELICLRIFSHLYNINGRKWTFNQ